LDAQLKAGKFFLGRQVFEMNKTVGYGYKRIGNGKKPNSGEGKASAGANPTK
jgi:hypothetical protein